MKPLSIPGYSVAAAALLAGGEGTAATSLFLALPIRRAGHLPVVIGRWNHEAGGWSERQAFHDLPDAGSGPQGDPEAGAAPAFARAYAAYASRLAAEVANFLALGAPLSGVLRAPLILGHDHARGIRAARRKSMEELGHAGWADTLVDAYVDPFGSWAAMDAAGADHVEHEEELW